MAQLTMPNVGEGVTEGTVVRWIKHEGDRVELDEPIVEVETDKAVVEIPSPVAGTLSRILVQEGEVVSIGTLLAEFDSASTPAVPPTATGAEQAERETAAAAPVASARQPASAAPATARTNGAAREGRTRQYSPVVMKLAAEHNIDLSLVLGTGIDGRVTRQDVMRYIENPAAYTAPPSPSAGVVGVEARSPAPPPAAKAQSPAAEPAPTPPPPAPAPAPAPDAVDTVEPLSATRRTIAQRMTESHTTIPVAWMAVEADVTGLVALRERLRADFEAGEGVKLTFMPFFTQAIVAALKAHPQLNATFGEQGLVRHRRFDIGIAMATEWGLVVPVVRDAGDLSLAGLVRRMDELSAKARARKLSVEDMRGATFTIDNTGAFGSLISQPIVPVGQAAIITTEAIRREVRPLDDGAIGARSVMNLCISFDHRALDGAEVGGFMRAVREQLEAYRADQTAH